MTVFREESGAVGLSGRDLPAAQALAGHASVVARAGQYEASGAFPGQAHSSLQALAYLHLLNGVTAGDAIAFARTAAAEPPDGPGPDDGDGGHDDPDAGDDGLGRARQDSAADRAGDDPGATATIRARTRRRRGPGRRPGARMAATVTARPGRQPAGAARGDGPAGHPAGTGGAPRGEPAARPPRPGDGP